jgi:hypothetical protein
MKRVMFTLLCLVAPVAFGATSLEALRASASAARAQVSSTRAAQQQGQAELDKLGAQIEALKARAKGKLLPGGELDAALKKSQELSASLTSSASALSSQEGTLETANLALLSELSNELSRARADFDRQTDRAARTQLIARMRKLRAEREQVRATLPAAKVPALEAVKPSDDPEDLLEQADLAKDNEDKVRKQLQALEKRIAEAKEERDLDNRVRQFLGDEALFDESDRRLRVTRTETPAAQPAAPLVQQTDSAPPPPPQAQGGSVHYSAGAPPAQPNVSFGLNPAGRADTPAANPTGGSADTGKTTGPQPQPASPRTVVGSDQRPQVGGHVSGHDEDDDLEDLEIQRAKLKGLAEELNARATQLQKKAQQLK